MSQWANVVEQFAPITFRRFLPNAPSQSDVTGSVHTPPLSAPVASANLPDARISCFRHRSGCYFLFSVMWLVATARLQSELEMGCRTLGAVSTGNSGNHGSLVKWHVSNYF